MKLRRALWAVTWIAVAVIAIVVIGLRLFKRLGILTGGAGVTDSALASEPAVGRDPRVEISQTNHRYLSALRHADAVSYGETFHDDALVMPARGPIVRGRAAIEEAMSATLSAFRFLEAEMSTVDLRLNGETAIETGHYRYLIAAAGGGSPRTLVGRYAIVWIRQNECWRIALDSAQPGVVDA